MSEVALERVKSAKARLVAQANPIPVAAKSGQKILMTENASVGAGKDKSKEDRVRALTLAEAIYNAERRRKGDKGRTMTFAMLMAADRYRITYLEAHGTSVGVSSYGGNPGGSVPWARSGTSDDRLSNRSALIKARLALCGVTDESGEDVLDSELLALVEAAVIETTDIPTQVEIGLARTGYGPDTKQVAAAGAVVLGEALRRLVLYFGLERGR